MGFPTGQGYDPRNQLPNTGENPFARVGWWVDQNALGDSRQLDMPTTAGRVISVTSCDKIAGPMPYSVTLNREIIYPPRFNDIGANCDVRAVVTFGSGASSQRIVCDWNPGTQLDFSGSSFVRIDALSYAPDPDRDYLARVVQEDTSIAPAVIKLGASTGMTAGPHPRPRFTQRLRTLGAGADSAIIVPPPWAHAVQVAGGSTEGGSIFVAGIELAWIAPDGLPFTQLVGTDLDPYAFVPIPAGSRLQVSNNTASNQRITLIWELAL